MHRHFGGVQHDFGGFLQFTHDLAFLGDAIDDAPVILQRVRAAALFEAADQQVIAGLEEEHAVVDAGGVQRVQGLAQLREQRLGANVHDHRELRDGATRVGHQFRQGGQQRRREVLHHIPSVVFQGVGGSCPSGT